MKFTQRREYFRGIHAKQNKYFKNIYLVWTFETTPYLLYNHEKKKDYFSIKMNSHRSPGVRNASQDLTTEHVNMSTERNWVPYLQKNFEIRFLDNLNMQGR